LNLIKIDPENNLIFKKGDYLTNYKNAFEAETLEKLKNAVLETIKTKRPHEISYNFHIDEKVFPRVLKIIPYRKKSCLFFLRRS